MPDVYDPTGGSMFRSRRRRKKNAERPKAVAAGKPKNNASASQTQMTASLKMKTSRDDSLEFCSSVGLAHHTDSAGVLKNRRTGTKRKQSVRMRSNDTKANAITPIDPRSFKRGKENHLHKPSSVPPPLPPVATELSSSERRRSDPKRDNSSNTFENCFQYAIALDTRHIDTAAGKDDQQDFLQNVKNFLWTTFRRRGFSTPAVTWTESFSSNDKTNIRIRSEPTERDNSDNAWFSVNELPIPSSLEDETTKMPVATRLPKGLLAHSSWNVVGDLVEATVDGINPLAPLKLVVFTSAASFLLDDNSTNHTSGIDAFWEKSQQYFRESKLQSIEIVVVMGETIIDRTKDQRDASLRNDSLLDDSDIEKLNADNVGVDKCLTGFMASQIGILKTMKRYLESKVETDLEMSRSHMHLNSKIDGKQLPVNISITAVDIAVDFHSLCQKWSRESLHSAIASKLDQSSPMISFELPETSDFDACDISFAAYYKNMPFRVDSPQASRLYEDLILLSEARLQVVQLVSVSSIDASLIYGVTIGLRCAHESNEESHHEKNYLVQSLFHRLATRDCALLLQSNNDQDLGHRGNSKFDGLFHSSEERQLFLFMPEFAVSKEGPAAPKSGVLCRVSSVDHILQDASASDLLKPIHPPHVLLGAQKSTLGSNPFSDYVEDSLDSLHCSPLNPWIQGRENKSTHRPDIAEVQKRVSNEPEGSPRGYNWKGETFEEAYQQVAYPKTSMGNEKEVPSDNDSIGSDVSVSDESERSGSTKGAAVSNSKSNSKDYSKIPPAKDHQQDPPHSGSTNLRTAEQKNANRHFSSSSSSSCSSSTSSESSLGDFYY